MEIISTKNPIQLSFTGKKKELEILQQKLTNNEKALEEVRQVKEAIESFVTEKVTNNSELQNEWKLLEKLELYEPKTKKGKQIERKMRNFFQPLAFDVMLSKVKPQMTNNSCCTINIVDNEVMPSAKAARVKTNLSKNFGIELKDVKTAFERSEGKSIEEVYTIFKPFIDKIEEKYTIMRSSFPVDVDTLFITKRPLGHYFAADRNSFIDPSQNFGEPNNYLFSPFLPCGLHEKFAESQYATRNGENIITHYEKEVQAIKNQINAKKNK